jgi:hypothetical protein
VSEYRIEKVRRPVTLLLADGSELRGDIFVHPVSRFSAEPQGADDFLNEDEAYFALALDHGAPVLVAKDNVIRAEASSAAVSDDLEMTRVGLDVEVTLVGGHRCVGCVFPDTRADRARLIDFLNGFSQRFLALFEGGRVTLVNRQAVAHVREVN